MRSRGRGCVAEDDAAAPVFGDGVAELLDDRAVFGVGDDAGRLDVGRLGSELLDCVADAPKRGSNPFVKRRCVAARKIPLCRGG